MAPTATLKNWEIIKTGNNMFAKGRVFKDSRGIYNDGDVIITTPIIAGGGGRLATYDCTYNLEN